MVVPTPLGPVIAAVDAKDNAVSFYTHRAGRFVRVGSISTGRLPAQIVSGDLVGDGGNDLVVRNVDDGTLSVIPEGVVTRILGGAGGTLPAISLHVGVGVSDVARHIYHRWRRTGVSYGIMDLAHPGMV